MLRGFQEICLFLKHRYAISSLISLLAVDDLVSVLVADGQTASVSSSLSSALFTSVLRPSTMFKNTPDESNIVFSLVLHLRFGNTSEPSAAFRSLIH
jgi:hypothetical protein